MRSTKASAAIERLKRRSNDAQYSMVMSSNGLFSLVLTEAIPTSGDLSYQAPKSQRLCEPMPMEEFVAFVNAYGPQTPKKVSKLDIAFSEQLANSKKSAVK